MLLFTLILTAYYWVDRFRGGDEHLGQETVGGVRRAHGGVRARHPLPHSEGGEPHQRAPREGEARGKGDCSRSQGTYIQHTKTRVDNEIEVSMFFCFTVLVRLYFFVQLFFFFFISACLFPYWSIASLSLSLFKLCKPLMSLE